MTDEERTQVLKMVEQGKITAEQALHLIQVLAENPDGSEFEAASQGVEAHPGLEPEQGIAQTAAKARSLWHIPLWIGVGVSLLSGLLMYWLMQTYGIGFWFYCSGLLLFLGVAIIALAASSRSARWLFVQVEQRPGETPSRIVFGFPLPLRLVAWFLRTFGRYIPRLGNTHVDEVIQAVETTTSVQGPLLVNVEDDGDGERVQVYIG